MTDIDSTQDGAEEAARAGAAIEVPSDAIPARAHTTRTIDDVVAGSEAGDPSAAHSDDDNSIIDPTSA